jgi:hypothetical protein
MVIVAKPNQSEQKATQCYFPTVHGRTRSAMKLYVVCRSVGSENNKRRPAFYSKTLALASLLRAVENVDGPTELVFANDGPIPAERVRMMADAGEVLPVRCGSNRSSYRLMIKLPTARGWAADDLVWFSEDDYLLHHQRPYWRGRGG